MHATSPPTIAMDTTEEGGPINSLPEDLLRNIFEKFNSSWGPWVPWAPVGWSPPPPLAKFIRALSAWTARSFGR